MTSRPHLELVRPVYQNPYAEVVAEGMDEARARERHAFDRVIGLLDAAERDPRASTMRVEALFYLDRFWKMLLEDLAQTGNGLPDALKANLISIGFWVLREIAAVRDDGARPLAALIEINAIIRDGLE